MKIIAALQVKLTEGEQARVWEKRAPNQFNTGQYDKAITAGKRCVEIEPSGADAHAFFGSSGA